MPNQHRIRELLDRFNAIRQLGTEESDFLLWKQAHLDLDSLEEQLETMRSALERIVALDDDDMGMVAPGPEHYGALSVTADIAREGLNPAISPESPCSVCGTYGHFTHNHERETSSPASERQ